jgi:hypothetical protein
MADWTSKIDAVNVNYINALCLFMREEREIYENLLAKAQSPL